MQDTPYSAVPQVVQPPVYQDDDQVPLNEIVLPKRTRHSTRRIIIIAACLLLALAVGMVYAVMNHSSVNTSYQAVRVNSGDLIITAVEAGSIQATTYQADFSTNQGIVTAIDVSVGQQVSAGQVLAQLDTTSLEDQLKVAQAQLQQAEDSGNAGSIQVAEAQVTLAQDNLQAATLKAPHAGTVSAINGSVGGTAGGGGNGAGFITITDTSALTIVVNVDESTIAQVAVGDPVSFTISAYGNRRFAGKVAGISQNGNNNSGSGLITYPVTVSIDATSLNGASLIPKMTVEATITTMTRHGVLLLSDDAISFVNLAVSQGLIHQAQVDAALSQADQMLNNLIQGRGVSIWQDNPSAGMVVVVRDQQLVVVPVVLGLTDGNSYEVLKGLGPADTVAVSPGSSSATSKGASQVPTPVQPGSKKNGG